MSTQMPHGPELEHPRPTANPLTVVVINDFASVTGGSDRVALAEAQGLARRGHQVTLLAGQGAPSADILEAGITVRSTGQHTTAGDPRPVNAAARGIWNRSGGSLVREALRGLDPALTVVHIHGFTEVLSASVVRPAV